MNKYIVNAYELLREAKTHIPTKTQTEAVQICKKLWAAWAQATKAYKHWRTERHYHSIIGELYRKYPDLENKIREVHIRARFLHCDGFYEGVYSPVKSDAKIIEEGIKIMEKILNSNLKQRR